jgi:type I restriction enzyme S subunit
MKTISETNTSITIEKSKYKKFRFDQIAVSISERVEPQNTDLEIYYGLEHLDSNTLHLSRNGVPSDVEGTKLRVYPGDIIFGKRRAYQRKAAICNVDAICSAHAMVLRANPKVIHPKLFPFFLHSDLFMNRAIDISVGSLSPTINWGVLKEQEFSLPPLNEQEKLAELLWAGNKLVHSLQEISIKLDQIIKSKLFSISETNNKVDNEVKKVEEVVEVLDNKRKPLNEKERYEMKGNIPYFGANGVVDYVNDFIFDEELVLIAEDGGSFHEYQTKPIAYKISGKSWVNNHAHVLRAKSNLTIDWLFYSLVHKDIRNFIIGSTRTKLNKSELLKIKVWAPPLDVQLKLVSEFNDLTNNQTLANKQADEVSALSKEIINNIFNGI